MSSNLVVPGFHDLERSSPSPLAGSYRDDPDESNSPNVLVTGGGGYRDDPTDRGYQGYRDSDESGGGGIHDDDVDDDAGGIGAHHSLPHVEDVRMRAMYIAGLKGPSSLQSFCTRIGSTPTRRNIILAVLVVTAVIVGLSVGIPKSKEKNSNNDNNSSLGGSGPLTDFTFASPKEEQIVRYLTAVSSVDDLRDLTSPQRRAARWLALNDTLNVPIPPLGQVDVAEESIPLLQRYAVVLLYYALNGPSWQTKGISLGFLTPSTHECLWNKPIMADNDDGTTDGGSTTVTGIICTSRKVVTGFVLPGINTFRHKSMLYPEVLALLPQLEVIQLDKNNIYGELPTTLATMSNLKILSLAGNHLGGKSGRALPDMTVFPTANLQTLDLSNNGYVGGIPEDWDFTRLRHLYLSGNELTGALPTNVSQWTNLQTLALDQNSLAGPLDVLNQMRKLQFLYLEHNDFAGSIPDFFKGGYSRKLTILDISDNHLTGNFPSHLFSLPELQVLDAHRNSFGGPLPNIEVNGESVLQYIALQDNSFTGQLPWSWPKFLTKLTHLDVSNNQMRGQIPELLAGMTSLQLLFLSEYRLVSDDFLSPPKFPEILQEIPSLKFLSWNKANLNGSIPTWLGALSNLYYLDLSYNALSGTIPTELGDLTHLKFLLLDSNKLVGTIPTQLAQINRLQALSVELNADITGSISSDDPLCKNLHHMLHFSSNCGSPDDGCPNCQTSHPKIKCACCTNCCKDSYDQTCTNFRGSVKDLDDWKKGYDISLEYTFIDKSVSVSMNPN